MIAGSNDHGAQPGLFPMARFSEQAFNLRLRPFGLKLVMVSDNLTNLIETAGSFLETTKGCEPARR